MKFFTKLSASTLLVCLFAFAPLLVMAQPANDLCADATLIACGDTLSGTNVAATGTGQPTTLCTTTPGDFGVWYKFIGNGDVVTAATCLTSSFDSKINVYSGSCGSLTCVGGNDDGCGSRSTVTFNTLVGTDYYILVTGFGSATSAFTINVGCVTPLPPPANDLCTSATVVACGDTVAATNVDATNTGQPTATCGTSPGGPGVWYRYVGNGDIVTVATCATVASFDTKLNVYSGACGTTNLTCVGGNDDGCGTRSSYTFNSAVGTDYYILVTGFSGATSAFTFTVSCVTPPANDVCANAIPITCASGTVYGTNTNATNVGNPSTCTTAPGSAAVWYTFVGTGELVTLSTCDSSSFNSKLNVYSGSCGTFTCVTGNDDNLACTGGTNRSEVRFLSAAGTNYYVLVSGSGSASGNFGLTITCAPSAAANDSCVDVFVCVYLYLHSDKDSRSNYRQRRKFKI